MAFATGMVATNAVGWLHENLIRPHAAHNAEAVYYPGAFAGLNITTGYFAKFDGTNADILFDGIIDEDFKQTINAGTAAGAAEIRIRHPRMIQVRTTTPITVADVRKPVYAAGHDDGRVQLTVPGSGNTVHLGFIQDVIDANTCLISVNLHTRPTGTSFPQPAVASLTNNTGGTANNTLDAHGGFVRIAYLLTLNDVAGVRDIVTDFTPGFTGRVVGLEFVVDTKVTTAAKTLNLNVEIGSTDVTGGVLALTSANTATSGVVITSSAVTGTNTFTATDKISVEASNVSQFSEGDGMLYIVLENTAIRDNIADLGVKMNDLLARLRSAGVIAN